MQGRPGARKYSRLVKPSRPGRQGMLGQVGMQGRPGARKYSRLVKPSRPGRQGMLGQAGQERPGSSVR